MVRVLVVDGVVWFSVVVVDYVLVHAHVFVLARAC